MKLNKLILASRNPHKIGELESLVSDLGITLLSALDVEHLEEVEEDQPDLQGNAVKKATYVYRQTGIPALADDTGLEVDALGGAPGVYSARYAGEDASYQDNLEKLLEEMKDHENRTAQFRTVIALVSEEGVQTFEGVCKGEILRSPRGSAGFGYDPVFLPEGYQDSFAGLPPSVKNAISHRGRAIRQLTDFLGNTIS